MKKIILPRCDENGDFYISYSQIDTWRTSKRSYIRKYFFGENQEDNAYMLFGKKVEDALEKYEFDDFTKSEQEFLKTIPRYDEFQRKVTLEMNGFYVLGFIDSSTVFCKGSILKKILDYKTGSIEAQQSKYLSDTYDQLEIYAAALLQETGIMPESAVVVLIDRKGNPFKGERLKLGKSYINIIKEITDERIKKVVADIQQIAEEISFAYQVFLKLKSL